MRLDKMRRSENVEDVRGRSPGPGRGRGVGLGLGGTLIALAIAYFLGVDPSTVVGVMEGAQQTAPAQAPQSPVAPGTPADTGGDFVAAVLGDTEDTWRELFRAAGSQYEPPKLVLFANAVQSGCGMADAGGGPFYCPGDQKVYIDLAFYRQLETEFRAPGDFAKAYVLAHEVGHHVQTVTGVSEQVRAAQARAGEAERNLLQVMMELQADCYAGIWAHHSNRSRGIVESGDIEEALGAASSVGDDTIQKRMQGYVQPESFTHGSAQQRVSWFRRGYESGELKSCDTFNSRRN